MGCPALEPILPALVQVALEISTVARLLTVDDLMQHFVPPTMGLVGVSVHDMADDTGTHLHHGVVSGAGGVIFRVA